MLVHVHIVGGNKDLAIHLKGLTLRVRVVQDLTEILRSGGYPGYERSCVNSPDKVASRLNSRYTEKYGQAAFIPEAVEKAVNVIKNQKTSIVQDKVATPSDAPNDVQRWDASARPHHIVRLSWLRQNIFVSSSKTYGSFC